MCAQKRVVAICNAVNNRVIFGFQRFQRHVHTYRILPDADGLLAVQVSVHRHMTPNPLPDEEDWRKEKHNRCPKPWHKLYTHREMQPVRLS